VTPRPPPVPDEIVLARLGIDRSNVLGEGGEATVYALDADRVLRLPKAAVPASALDGRRALLDVIRDRAPFATPVVLDHIDVDGRTIVIERRLPGRNALEVLDTTGDRAALVRSHLDAAAAIADLPCPSTHFGEVWGDFAIEADSFRSWSVARLGASLAIAGERFAHLDAERLTEDLLTVLPTPEPAAPVLVHLDAYLGNMLADGDQISAVLDFGPMTIGGPPHLDALACIAYLAPEIARTANDADRGVARDWAEERGLLDALEPTERWVAAYWAFAHDDEQLHRWCARVLGAT
jgi:aminoglycoside phosphotransferase (APT) family kinase protein